MAPVPFFSFARAPVLGSSSVWSFLTHSLCTSRGDGLRLADCLWNETLPFYHQCVNTLPLTHHHHHHRTRWNLFLCRLVPWSSPGGERGWSVQGSLYLPWEVRLLPFFNQYSRLSMAVHPACFTPPHVPTLGTRQFEIFVADETITYHSSPVMKVHPACFPPFFFPLWRRRRRPPGTPLPPPRAQARGREGRGMGSMQPSISPPPPPSSLRHSRS